MNSVPSHLAEQWARLSSVLPAASIRAFADNSAIVTVPDVPLPSGWSKATTTIDFIVPVGYPAARPDCFYADLDLRLSNGSMPGSSGLNQLPHDNAARLWFSWHVTSWQAGRDDLLTYVGVIQARLNRPQ